MIPLIGLIVGVLIGLSADIHIPIQFSSYVAVAILAALDSAFGGVKSYVQNKFSIKIFITGFFGNSLIAALLTYMGERIGVNLYFAAIIVFGTRLFNNFAVLRRFVLNKSQKNDNI